MKFGDEFNKSVNYLPQNLTNLTFGFYFDQSVDNLPKNLTHLFFGNRFNQSIVKLSKSLVHLGFYSNNNLKNNIPNNIEYLTIYFDPRNKINDLIENIPCGIREINVMLPEHISYLKKIPFGCRIMCNGSELFL